MALQKNHNNSKIMRPEDSNDGEAVIDAGDLECEDTDAGGDSEGDSDVGEDNAESHDDFIFVVIASQHSLILPIMPVISLTDLCQDCPL